MNSQVELSYAWIDQMHRRTSLKVVVLHMDSSKDPSFRELSGAAYNGFSGCAYYHPLFCYNQFGDLEQCDLRPGTVHSAEGIRGGAVHSIALNNFNSRLDCGGARHHLPRGSAPVHLHDRDLRPTMGQIRAIHVVPRVIAESSGPSHVVPHLCRALADEGLDIALKVLEPLPARALPFPVTAYPTLPLPGMYRLGVSPPMARALNAAAQDADIIHSHSLWMMPNIYVERAARRGGCKLVVSPHGTLEPWAWQRARWRKAPIWWLGQRRAVQAADLLHATAESEYDSIRAQDLAQPVAIIPNGVTIPANPPHRPDGVGERTLLFLSRIHPKKQVGRLLGVWQRLERVFADWRLVIAGPLGGPYSLSMVTLARNLGLQRAYFIGEVVGEAKWDAYGAADLFVLPTRSENFGLTIAEALAAGTPVITTRGAPWGELKSRGCGWWIPDDEGELEATLHQAMTRPRAELKTMGALGRQWMEQEFSWSLIGEKMAASYRWLLGDADRPDWIRD